MKNELETLSKSELIQRVLLMGISVDTQQKQLSQSTTQVHLLNGKLAQAEEQILLFKRLIDYFTEADPPVSLETDPLLTGVNGQ